MAAPYLIALQDLVEASLDPERAGATVCKHFFSGAAAYIDGTIFATLTPAGLAFKLPGPRCEILLKADAKPLRYFPGSPIKAGYVVFEDAASLHTERLASLMTESISHVLATGR